MSLDPRIKVQFVAEKLSMAWLVWPYLIEVTFLPALVAGLTVVHACIRVVLGVSVAA